MQWRTGTQTVAVRESWKTRLTRWGFNWFPAYRGSGGRIELISADWKEIRIRLPLNWRTRNYVGTIFGGSMYSAIDPIFMIMLIKLLGREYIVWDKSAAIRFRRPGRSTLRATFRLGDEELQAIRQELSTADKCERRYVVELADETGEVCAVCEKVISIRKKTREN